MCYSPSGILSAEADVEVTINNSKPTMELAMAAVFADARGIATATELATLFYASKTRAVTSS